MATISNTPRPGYVWDSTDNVWYPIGVGNHNHSEIAKTIVDAKGDLIVGTAADTVARQAVGTDGQMLVASSAQTNGVAWADQPIAAGKNGVINGAYDIWQRGTSFSLAASTTYTYVADRWQTLTGTNQACTISRQSVNDSTNLPNIQYCLRYQRNSGQTGTGTLYNVQSFETATSIPFAGKTVTYSFYARAGANYSAASSTLAVNLDSGTGTDQNRLNGGYTGNTALITSSATLTTTWQRFTYTATVPSTATELCTFFGFTPTGTAGTNDYYEITGIQLEIGSIATPFSRAGGTIQGELAACQRYYYRLANAGASGNYGIGYAYSTTSVANGLRSPVTMRITPTVLDYATIELTIVGVANYAITGLAIDAGTSGPDYVTLLATGATGLTANRPYSLKNASSTAGYIGLSSEL